MWPWQEEPNSLWLSSFVALASGGSAAEIAYAQCLTLDGAPIACSNAVETASDAGLAAAPNTLSLVLSDSFGGLDRQRSVNRCRLGVRCAH